MTAEEGLGIFAVPAPNDDIPADPLVLGGNAGFVLVDARPDFQGPLVEVPATTPSRRPAKAGRASC